VPDTSYVSESEITQITTDMGEASAMRIAVAGKSTTSTHEGGPDAQSRTMSFVKESTTALLKSLNPGKPGLGRGLATRDGGSRGTVWSRVGVIDPSRSSGVDVAKFPSISEV
jgi:hypothetical protein